VENGAMNSKLNFGPAVSACIRFDPLLYLADVVIQVVLRRLAIRLFPARRALTGWHTGIAGILPPHKRMGSGKRETTRNTQKREFLKSFLCTVPIS